MIICAEWIFFSFLMFPVGIKLFSRPSGRWNNQMSAKQKQIIWKITPLTWGLWTTWNSIVSKIVHFFLSKWIIRKNYLFVFSNFEVLYIYNVLLPTALPSKLLQVLVSFLFSGQIDNKSQQLWSKSAGNMERHINHSFELINLTTL